MPFKVKLKLFAIGLLGLAVLSTLLMIQPFLAGAFLVLVLIYIEMIYPKWNFFGSAILDVKSRGAKPVAITFDDGPSEWTLPILETLKNEQVKATFFLLGSNIDRYPEIARRIQTDGHTLGFHGESHTKFHLKGPKFIAADLDASVESFKKAGLLLPTLIRFPHGFKNIFAVREIKKRNLKLCGWGRGVWDSKRPGVDWIVKHSLLLRAGEILLLHDGNGAHKNPDRSQTAEALPQIIKGLRARGFEFVMMK
ncbi:MAG: polysaccharide deacetylase [Bacteriovoracaceae bacterium]|nr:polysaccharide deacetylase [Bacteriovoracaceae bacterium]